LQRRLGNDDDSRAFFERSLAMTESTLNANHPFVAQILRDYAALLGDLGERGRADELEARARAIEIETKKRSH
jgi:hypothetical protein